jgi:hypothetical protein
MDSFNMKGRGDDATLTERQVKRLSARQVRAAAAVSAAFVVFELAFAFIACAI